MIACLLYAELSSGNPKYQDSLRACSSQLAQLGVTDWGSFDPVVRDEGPKAPETPPMVSALGQDVVPADDAGTRSTEDRVAAPDLALESDDDEDIDESLVAGTLVPSNGDEANDDLLPEIDADATSRESPLPRPPPGPEVASAEFFGMPLLGITTAAAEDDNGLDDEMGFDFERDSQLPAYARSWTGKGDIAPVLDAYEGYLRDQIARAPAAWTHLSKTIDADFDALRVLLADCGTPIVAEEMRLRAKDARALALIHEPNTRMEALIRRRWLVAGLLEPRTLDGAIRLADERATAGVRLARVPDDSSDCETVHRRGARVAPVLVRARRSACGCARTTGPPSATPQVGARRDRDVPRDWRTGALPPVQF